LTAQAAARIKTPEKNRNFSGITYGATRGKPECRQWLAISLKQSNFAELVLPEIEKQQYSAMKQFFHSVLRRPN